MLDGVELMAICVWEHYHMLIIATRISLKWNGLSECIVNTKRYVDSMSMSQPFINNRILGQIVGYYIEPMNT